jgi:predicted  nucleic acid-binding Zn-ribbon protein
VAVPVPVSVGELIDKLTILSIKEACIADSLKLANIRRERQALDAVVQAEGFRRLEGLVALEAELRAVNEQLWKIEDQLRECERQSSFGSDFVDLARAVYTTNDQRADLKRQINHLTGSEFVEEKSYACY